MKYTIADVEDAARTILLDTYEDNYRFTSREIYLALRDGMKKIRNIRPETRYVNGMLRTKLLRDGSASGKEDEMDFTLPSSAEGYDTFKQNYVNMEDRWQEALVYYVVFRMYQKDDSDTVNNAQSTYYYNMFVEGAKA